MSSTDPSGALDPVEALERLGRLALRENCMRSLLQAVADLAKEVMPGNPEASVSLLINDKASTAVFTGQLARDCDESQYGRGYGPCLHAAGTGELVEVADAQTETRWRDYMEHAVECGALSSLAVPLPINEGIAGALNVYARKPNAFDEDSRSVATRFAAHAAVVAANMYAYEEARDLVDHLERRVESRAVVERATGILMERHDFTADQALQALTRVARETGAKVRQVADALVRTGELPPA
ncbi:GAF and ANTAR domain-containing protein [Geodermatophilus sabuli]|uniref:GAF domain-containing protein n=1 Tax=Geodermatophilus sabuli TaxID=1564158 RepID=A0A285EJB3_9ACTN|nr:GAF and ANTAR domain-containing protein [Geodermatophilus sabuli]MBB3083095.1 GAF domain-containing protein [Geodermatophilus sabuli]SNX98091.1 GAF domain-containing protein [Geodermatophilus sabuli]